MLLREWRWGVLVFWTGMIFSLVEQWMNHAQMTLDSWEGNVSSLLAAFASLDLLTSFLSNPTCFCNLVFGYTLSFKEVAAQVTHTFLRRPTICVGPGHTGTTVPVAATVQLASRLTVTRSEGVAAAIDSMTLTKVRTDVRFSAISRYLCHANLTFVHA